MIAHSPSLSAFSLGTIAQSRLSTIAGVALIACVVIVNETNFRLPSISTEPDLQTLIKIFVCLACGLYGVLNLRVSQSLTIHWPTLFMLLLGAWAILSSFKSINPSYALATCGTLWCLILFALACIDRLGQRLILLSSLAAVTVFLVLCWCAYFVAPGINGFDPTISHARDIGRLGGLVHPNGTAKIAAIGVVLAMAALHKKYLPPQWLGILLVFLGLTLFWTGSRTWMVTTLFVVVAVTWSLIGLRSRLAMSLGGLLAAVLLATFVVNVISAAEIDRRVATLSRSGDSSEIYTMTGRAELWEFCSEKIMDSPIFGFGYGCQRFVIADGHFWKTRHAHNILINLILGCGMIGGVLFLLVIAAQIMSLIHTPALFPCALLGLLFIGGMTENPLFNPIPGAMTLLFLISLVWTTSQESDVAQHARDTTSVQPQ